MPSGNALRIEILSPSQAEDTALMSTVASLINEVYEVAEKGLWAEGTSRTTTDEVAALTRASEGDHHGGSGRGGRRVYAAAADG